jgi:hypothetical protein
LPKMWRESTRPAIMARRNSSVTNTTSSIIFYDVGCQNIITKSSFLTRKTEFLCCQRHGPCAKNSRGFIARCGVSWVQLPPSRLRYSGQSQRITPIVEELPASPCCQETIIGCFFRGQVRSYDLWLLCLLILPAVSEILSWHDVSVVAV